MATNSKATSSTLARKTALELETIQEEVMGVSIIPEYRRRFFRCGYHAFHNLLTIADCPYSTKSEAYDNWRAGWVVGWKEYVKDNNLEPIKKVLDEKDQGTASQGG